MVPPLTSEPVLHDYDEQMPPPNDDREEEMPELNDDSEEEMLPPNDDREEEMPELHVDSEEEMLLPNDDSEEEEEDKFVAMVDKVKRWERRWIVQAGKHGVGVRTADILHKLVKEALEARLDPKLLGTYPRRRLRALENGIPVLCDVWYKEDEESTDYLELKGLKAVSMRLQQQYACIRTYASLAEVRKKAIALHKGRPGFNPDLIVLSLDGVPESSCNQSGSVRTLEVICVRFHGCSIVWPLEIFRCKDKQFEVTSAIMFHPIIDQIINLKLTLEFIICDAPKRCFCRSQKQHTGYYSCDLCPCAGERVNRTHVFTTETLRESKRRTHERAVYIFSRIAQLVGRNAAETDALREGYREPVPTLLQLKNFDLIRDIPIDAMHLIFLGVFKSLMKRLFGKGDTLPGESSRNEKRLAEFKKVARKVKLPSEFSRALVGEPLFFKALQYMCLCVIAFPMLFHILLPGDRYFEEDSKSLHITMRLCYLVRAAMMDNPEFYNIERIKSKQRGCSLLDIQKRWYIGFEERFGRGRCSYNAHLLGAHLMEIRRLRSLTDTSAFPLESEYGCMLRKFVVGTRSVGKQALTNSYLVIGDESHRCEHRLRFNLKRNKAIAEDFYVFDKSKGLFYSLKEKVGPETFIAAEIVTSRYLPLHCPEDIQDWDCLGVAKYEREAELLVILKVAAIDCKAAVIRCGHYKVIVAVPKSWLALK